MTRGSESGSRARRLLAALGVVRPDPGTLGAPFVTVLVLGTAIAVVVGGMNGSAESAATPALLLSLVIWQPCIEELLFRGALQGELLRWAPLARSWLGLTAANGLAALAFALAHLVHQPPLWALSTLLPGLVFGWFRDRSGSVLPSLVLHAAFNAGFFTIL
jgi:membrane protease YdiL (CAAX protease family)